MNGPASPGEPGFGGSPFPAFPGRQRKTDLDQENDIVSQMAGMDMNQGPGPRGPPGRGPHGTTSGTLLEEVKLSHRATIPINDVALRGPGMAVIPKEDSAPVTEHDHADEGSNGHAQRAPSAKSKRHGTPTTPREACRRDRIQPKACSLLRSEDTPQTMALVATKSKVTKTPRTRDTRAATTRFLRRLL